MRKRRVLRWLCSAKLSGNSFLVVGTLVAILAPFVPLAGAALAPLIAAVAAILGVVLTASLVGALLGPLVW